MKRRRVPAWWLGIPHLHPRMLNVLAREADRRGIRRSDRARIMKLIDIITS